MASGSTVSLPEQVRQHATYRTYSAGNSPSTVRSAPRAPWTQPRDKDGIPVSVEAERQRRKHNISPDDKIDENRQTTTPDDGSPAPPNQPQENDNHDVFDSVWVQRLMVLLLLALCLLLPGALFRTHSPNTTLGDVSIAGWASIIAICLVVRPVVELVYVCIGGLIVAVARLRKRSPAKVEYYVDGMRSAVVNFVWIVTATIVFTQLVETDPFPPSRQPGEKTRAPSMLWWIPRLFICLIVTLAFGLLRAYVTRNVALKRRAAGYHQRVRDAVMAAKIVSILTKPIPARMIAPRAKQAVKPKKPKRSVSDANSNPSLDTRKQFRIWKAKAQAPSRLRKSEPDVASVSSGKRMEDDYGFLGNPASFLKAGASTKDVDIDNLLTDANLVQKEPIQVCKRARILRTVKDARCLGSALFDWYSGRKEDAAYVVTSDAEEKLCVEHLVTPLREGSRLRKHAIGLFDPGKLGAVTREQLMTACTEIFLGRKNLSNSLRDLDSIIEAIETFLLHVQYVVLFLAILIVFSTGEASDIAVTSGTTILAFSFIFADTCQHTFKSFILLFVRHPFDAGDRVEIEGMDKALYVQKMTLQYTVFTVWNGMVATIPNHELYSKSIFNVQRSGMMWDEAYLQISSKTTAEQLERLEQGFFAILRAHPFDFDEQNSFFLFRDLVNSNVVTAYLIYAMRTNWQNGEHVTRRSIIVRGLMDVCEKEGITLNQVPQPVRLVNPAGLGMMQPPQPSPAPSASGAVFPPYS
eukprot:TRINITY_DN12002_c0_g3_i2.p1 TRINITY_DN12002_c0_g3~~TRINITY_DN12002_c0_g3_i2.p1  ORF type:complete len:750 (+),score=160.96 TRINITY_DN12002_c0_g3_i2:450-2699(+)